MAINANLEAYWKGDSTADTMGSHPATFNSGVTIGAGTGKFGDSWDFATTASYVSLASPTPNTSTFTAMAWAYNLRPDSAYRTLFYNGVGGVIGGMHFLTEPTSALAGTYANTTFTSTGTALAAASYTGWHHYAVVGSGGTFTLYVDGASIGSVTPTWPGTFAIAEIGGDSYGEGFAERLDDVAVWSRALTSTEITDIYNAGTAGNPLSSLFPVAVVPDITGTVLVPATFDGSGSTSVDYYHWKYTAVAPSSTLGNLPIPFPDSGATTPIDMTDNEGLWHFDSSVTADTSGLGANFTATGSPTLSAPGKVGSNRVVFDGANDGLEVALSGTSSTSGTISGWVKIGPAGFNGTKIIFGLEDGATIGGWRVLSVDVLGALNFYFYGGAITTAATLLANTWYHLVVSWQPDGGQDRVKVYVDGASVLNTLTSSLFSLPANTPFLVALHGTSGAWPGSPEYTPMEADELAVWSRALSDVEVADIYAAQSGALASLGSSSFTFTPDKAGTYTVNLEVASGASTAADAVISAAGGGPTSQGSDLQGEELQGAKLQGDT